MTSFTVCGLFHDEKRFDHAPSFIELKELHHMNVDGFLVYNTTCMKRYDPADEVPEDVRDVRLDILYVPKRSIGPETGYEDYIEYIAELQNNRNGPFTINEISLSAGLHPFWVEELWKWQTTRKQGTSRIFVQDFI